MNQNIDDLWLGILPEKYDKYLPYQKLFLRLIAATEYSSGNESDLTELYEQFLTLKTLAGVEYVRDTE